MMLCHIRLYFISSSGIIYVLQYKLYIYIYAGVEGIVHYIVF
jgi:hypothetical protein